MSALSHKAWVVIWSAALQWARVGTNALVFLLLSRWLSLSEIGAVAAVQAPILIAQTLVTTMIPEFVVQERLATQRRLSSVFWLSVSIGTLTTVAMAMIAPFVASGIDDEHSMWYMLAMAVCPAVWGLASVFEGLHRRALRTKVLAVRTTIASLVAAAVALIAGFNGLGGWALVLFTVLSAVTSCAITVLTCKWQPDRQLSKGYLRRNVQKLFALTGRHLLGAATIPVIQYATAWQLGTADAGVFQIATRLCSLVDAVVMTPYRFVVMPVFAMAKTSGEDTTPLVARAISIGSLLAVPAYLGLIVVAPALIPLALGELNGTPCILATQLLCLHGVASAPSYVINQVLVARGGAQVVFHRSMVIYALVVLPCVVATTYSVQTVALFYGVAGAGTVMVSALLLARRHLGVRPWVLLSSWLRTVAAGCAILVLFATYVWLGADARLSTVLIMAVLGPILYVIALRFVAPLELSTFLVALRREKLP